MKVDYSVLDKAIAEHNRKEAKALRSKYRRKSEPSASPVLENPTNCLPESAKRLGQEAEQVETSLSINRLALNLRSSSSEYVPASPIEEAIRDDQLRLKTIKGEMTKEFETACVLCGHRGSCPSRMA